MRLHVRLRGRLPRHARRVAPQIFEAVEPAFVAVEDVHDHLHVIEDDPLARWKTIDRCSANSVVFAQSCFDFAANRAQVRLRRSRAYNEEIGERGDAAQIEHDDLFGFLVVRQFGATPR